MHVSSNKNLKPHTDTRSLVDFIVGKLINFQHFQTNKIKPQVYFILDPYEWQYTRKMNI